MKNISKTLLLSTFSAIALSGCSSIWNGAGDNLTVAERHPISVDSQVTTLTLDVDPSSNELSQLDKARIKAFALRYLQNGHGPLTVTAPTGGIDDRVGQETSADVRQHLNDIGVPWEAMTGASYRAGGQGNERQVLLSYSHYVASASPCGIWEGEFEHAFKNIAPANFGCADQNNLAAMIADPRDLVQPQDSTAPDAIQRVRGVTVFREGEVTSSDTDNAVDAAVAN